MCSQKRKLYAAALVVTLVFLANALISLNSVALATSYQLAETIDMGDYPMHNISSDGSNLLIVNEGSPATVEIIDPSGNFVDSFDTPSRCTRAITYNGSMIVFANASYDPLWGCSDYYLREMDPKTGTYTGPLSANLEGVSALGFDGSNILVADNAAGTAGVLTADIRKIDATNYTFVETISVTVDTGTNIDGTWVHGVEWHNDNLFIGLGGVDKVYQFDVDLNLVKEIPVVEAVWYKGFAFVGDDLFLATEDGNNVGTIYRYEPKFEDVPPDYWAEDAIYKIYKAGITTGCCKDPLKFCPENPVNRDQMAVFLGRAKHDSNFTPPPATGIFADVPKWQWAADWIEQFYKDGLTKGCKRDPHDVQSPVMYYCPKYPVTRTTMAIFLLRAKHGANYLPPPTTGIFGDVGVNYWAADWIEQLYREGITTGCKKKPLMYCPSMHVTRAQMAVFLKRMLAPPEFLFKWGSSGNGNGQFNFPQGIALDSTGNVYVADSGNNRIQNFQSDGSFMTAWGTSGNGDGQFNNPFLIAVDSVGNVYVGDENNNRVQKFTANGVFITKWGSPGSGNGQFGAVKGIAIDSLGHVLVADSNQRIQKFTSDGVFLMKWGKSGNGDGEFGFIEGVAVDSLDNVYVADSSLDRVQKFSNEGVFLTKWGTSGSNDGQFSSPHGIHVDPLDGVYVVDTGNARVQKFTSAGVFLTKWGSQGSGDGQFSQPRDIDDFGGQLYVTDYGNDRIQVFR